MLEHVRYVANLSDEALERYLAPLVTRPTPEQQRYVEGQVRRRSQSEPARSRSLPLSYAARTPSYVRGWRSAAKWTRASSPSRGTPSPVTACRLGA